MRAATVALIVRDQDGAPRLIETLSSDQEISLLESALASGASDPLLEVYEARQRRAHQEDEFANYVEDLLSQPFLRKEIREHGVQWLRSKIRIEQYERSESEAAKIIADYAFRMFSQQQDRMDFFLAGPSSQVRIRVFRLSPEVPLVSAA